MDSKIKITIAIIIGLFVLSWIVAAFFDRGQFGNVAHIRINGVIMEEKGGFFDAGTAPSSEVVKFIKKANEEAGIKAILLDINSPGGAAVASAEIAEAVKKSNKTVVALIRDSGTSGAYWAASPAYKIVAHPLSITGSIGVYGSYLQFSGLLEKYNVSYERLVSGEYKDIGSPFKQLTDDERKSLQNTLDLMHEYFIQSVAENRNMSIEDVRKIANGNFYIGMEAKKLGLVDFLGSQDVAEEIIKKRENLTEVNLVEYKTKTSLFEALGSVMNGFGFSFGKGFANGVIEKSAGDIKV
jgi:protease-4